MNTEFDTEITTDDWRDSAAVLGLIRVFEEYDIPYNKEEIFTDNYQRKDWDTLKFNRSDITEEIYLKYVEKEYPKEMYHVQINNYIDGKEDYNDDDIKIINDLLKGNTIMKKVFSDIKFDGKNDKDILKRIEENRWDIIKETYRNKLLLYRNYCNTNQLFSEEQSVCRLNGYYVDIPKKGKSISYGFSTSSDVYKDRWYYDYIPFAFTYGHEAFFINDNSSIADLVKSNDNFVDDITNDKKDNEKVSNRTILFKSIIESSEFIEYDTEVVIKKSDNTFFETMYIRRKSIHIFKQLKNYKSICRTIQIEKDVYINIQEIVTEAIINLNTLDSLINTLLKKDDALKEKYSNYEYLINQLLKVNLLIRQAINGKGEDDNMEQNMKEAKSAAKRVVDKLKTRNQTNKIRSYRTKLTSAIVFKDYVRYCEILLNLADYTDMQFTFAYDLFDDFEKNKDSAYAFVNALVEIKDKDSEKKDDMQGKGED